MSGVFSFSVMFSVLMMHVFLSPVEEEEKKRKEEQKKRDIEECFGFGLEAEEGATEES